MDGNVLNSLGVHVGVARGEEAFDLKGERLYLIKASKIYRRSGELVGHLANPALRKTGSTEPPTGSSPDSLFGSLQLDLPRLYANVSAERLSGSIERRPRFKLLGGDRKG